MAFVRKVKTASGATAVQIAERVGGRDKVIEHLGSAHTDADLAALLAKARDRLHPGQGEFDLSAGAVPTGHAVITGTRHAVLWQVLTDAYARLGFDAIGDAAFAQLVLARIIEPTSKVDSLRVLDDLGIEHASLRTMTRTLGRVGTGRYRDQIAAACFTHAAASGDISLCLYDVTTLYFEAEKEDDLRKVGYSKERRGDPSRGRAAGRPARVPVGDRLLRRQQGRDDHDVCRSSKASRNVTGWPTWSSSPMPGCCPRRT